MYNGEVVRQRFLYLRIGHVAPLCGGRVFDARVGHFGEPSICKWLHILESVVLLHFTEYTRKERKDDTAIMNNKQNRSVYKQLEEK